MDSVPKQPRAPKPSRDKTAELDHGAILPLIVRLSIPAIIAQLITFLYNIVDRMYVARIEDAGIKLGEGNAPEADRIFNTAFSMLVLIGASIGAVAFFFAEPIVRLLAARPARWAMRWRTSKFTPAARCL